MRAAAQVHPDDTGRVEYPDLADGWRLHVRWIAGLAAGSNSDRTDAPGVIYFAVWVYTMDILVILDIDLSLPDASYEDLLGGPSFYGRPSRLFLVPTSAHPGCGLLSLYFGLSLSLGIIVAT